MVLETKQSRFEEQKTDLTLEKTQLNTTISDLRTSLSNPAQVSYYDAEAEKVITTTSSSTRRALQSELKTTIEDRDKLNLKLEAVMDSVMRIDTELLELEIGNEEQRELGPLKYLAETTGYPMGQVVNWFLLLIIFVFDPLAIALVVAANFAFTQIRRKEPEVKMSAPDGLEFNTPYTMEEVSEAFKRQDKKEELEIDEKRMNIIGQNGNDGLHYDNIITTTENLTKDEIENLSKEIGKTEEETNPTPINPSKKDLEKLAEVLNINYSDENVDLDRLTDTTQTLINKVVRSENEKNKNTLQYKGRK